MSPSKTITNLQVRNQNKHQKFSLLMDDGKREEEPMQHNKRRGCQNMGGAPN